MTIQHSHNFPIAARQSGAALVIGLVLLMALTLFAVSGMTVSTMDLRMADNSARSQQAFEAADSAIRAEIFEGQRLALTGTEVRDDIVRQNNAYAYNPPEANSDQPLATVSVDTVFRDVMAAPTGFEFDGGQRAFHFEVRAAATTPAGDARSNQTGGFYVLAPGL
ncbi:MAG: PilX N-terminal domain-containing pilus assembly protein [Pseudomonadota bacterium]